MDNQIHERNKREKFCFVGLKLIENGEMVSLRNFYATPGSNPGFRTIRIINH